MQIQSFLAGVPYIVIGYRYIHMQNLISYHEIVVHLYDVTNILLIIGFLYPVLSCRDDAGRLVRTERLRTKDITHRVKMKNYWQVSIHCLKTTPKINTRAQTYV